jgi:hypothetical protein
VYADSIATKSQGVLPRCIGFIDGILWHSFAYGKMWIVSPYVFHVDCFALCFSRGWFHPMFFL